MADDFIAENQRILTLAKLLADATMKLESSERDCEAYRRGMQAAQEEVRRLTAMVNDLQERASRQD